MGFSTPNVLSIINGLSLNKCDSFYNGLIVELNKNIYYAQLENQINYKTFVFST